VRSLLIFLIRFHAFFLFLMLAAVCIVLIYREKSFQRTAMITSANTVVGSIQGARNQVIDYFQLERLNDSLRQENALLRQQLSNAWFSDTIAFITVTDSARTQHYRYLPAEVINNSVHRFDNYLTLRAGSRHGVKRGMGVIGPQGAVGIVRDVSPNISRALSLLHHQITIPARLARSGDQGRVRYTGTDPDRAVLIDIGRHVRVQPGDIVVTSGYSTAFPADIMIGKVESHTVNHGTGFLEITLRLSTDFRRLQTVYIVDNLFTDEQQTLEGKNP